MGSSNRPRGRLPGLHLRVHRDAFFTDPYTYVQAVAWRLRGFKLRSRNMLAPLLGRSPSAYDLWMARNECSADAETGAGGVDIIPIIDCRQGDDDVAATLASILACNPDARPIVIGGAPVPGTLRIDQPRDLASLVDADGSWICPLLPGDRLARGAMVHYGSAARQSRTRLIYADDDLMTSGGRRSHPHFKPQWNADLFEHHDYVSGSACLFVDPAALTAASGSDWVRMLAAAITTADGAAVHLPRVLHHRRDRPAPVVPTLRPDDASAVQPLVSVIIPTRNEAALLRNCVDGLKRASYRNIELLIIDNGSDEPEALSYLNALEDDATVLRLPGPFNFSRLNNIAARQAQGEMLCFLNNDVEMIEDDWLSTLVGQAARPDLGAVGARLLYPDMTIQHAGVYTGIGGGAGHAHRFLREDEPGYFERARLPQQVSAVTAACLVVARDKFVAVGGFDEIDFPVAFNDVDLCLKLNERGWQSFYEPRAALIHHESKSRGRDVSGVKRKRFAGELAALKRKWHTDERTDPFHHPHLSRFSEQFVVAL